MALKVKVLGQFCKGCGYCVHFCPKKVLAFGTTRNALGLFFPVMTDAGSCVACGICATVCPDAAIELREESDNG